MKLLGIIAATLLLCGCVSTFKDYSCAKPATSISLDRHLKSLIVKDEGKLNTFYAGELLCKYFTGSAEAPYTLELVESQLELTPALLGSSDTRFHLTTRLVGNGQTKYISVTGTKDNNPLTITERYEANIEDAIKKTYYEALNLTHP